MRDCEPGERQMSARLLVTSGVVWAVLLALAARRYKPDPGTAYICPLHVR